MIGGEQRLVLENCLITTNTILYCKEWEKTVGFYKDQLELPIIFSTDWFVEFRLNAMSRLSIANQNDLSSSAARVKVSR